MKELYKNALLYLIAIGLLAYLVIFKIPIERTLYVYAALAIFAVIHYLVLRKTLNMRFPFESLRLKHLKKIKTVRWFMSEDIPDWRKHEYALSPYLFGLTIAFMLYTIMLLILLFAVLLPYKQQIVTSTSREQLELYTFISFLLWIAFFISILFITFSKTIFGKPRSQTTKGILIASAAALMGTFAYLLILSQIMPIDPKLLLP